MALPAETAVTNPVLEFTVATEGLLLVQVPPVIGETDRVVVAPIHIAFDPEILTTGLFLIVTGAVGNELQLPVKVNVKVAEPTDNPVTNPVLETEATDRLLEAHVPPEFGESCVVNPTHIEFAPVILTTGLGVIVIVVSLVQVEAVSVNLTVFVPAVNPVTVLLTRVNVPVPPATCDHVPPEEGDNVVLEPIHIGLAATKTVGLGLTVRPVVVF